MINLIVETINPVVILVPIVVILLFGITLLILVYRFGIREGILDSKSEGIVTLHNEYGNSILINLSQVKYFSKKTDHTTRVIYTKDHWVTVVESLEEIEFLLNK